ncbi:ankyrin repeat-containing domain protein [Coprinopsis sp. MPI-PUGE-AT-0042]|nr:ankyrin repeat-containing domain protein [Coprinopsis sp. MPI-PUGE-AT-0042]
MVELEILDWLSKINFRSMYLDNLSKRAPRTGAHFIEYHNFQQWVKSQGGVFWGTGIPGAGKTILASTVIEYLEYLAGQQKDVCVLFAYCRYTEPLSVTDVLAALVRQVLERHRNLASLVQSLYEHHQRERTRPTQNELVGLLLEIAKHFRTVFFILDGLDEASEAARFDLLAILSSLNLHFFITSRPLRYLESVVPAAYHLNIMAHHQDIALLIQSKLDRMPTLKALLGSGPFKTEVLSAVQDKAHGMILHASLQIDMLQHCLSIREIRQTLEQLPKQLEDMYTLTMKRIEAQPASHVSLAKKALLWVVFAERPLDVEELVCALATCPTTGHFDPQGAVSEASLLSICCGLITLQAEVWPGKTRQLVRLIHFTAKDALQRTLLADFAYPHELLTKICVSRLVACGLQNSPQETYVNLQQVLRDSPLLQYAYYNWSAHAHKWTSPEMLSAVEDFIVKCTSYPYHLRRQIHLLSALHLATAYGFPAILSRLFDVQRMVETLAPPHGLTLLMLATHSGHLDVVELLLQRPDTDINAVDNYGRTALMLASNPSVCTRLLQAPGINPNAEDQQGRTAVAFAASEYSEDTCLALIQHPGIQLTVDANARDTLLVRFSSHGYKRAVAELLKIPGLDLGMANADIALFEAAKRGRTEIVKLLLRQTGVNVNYKDRPSESTPLTLAAGRGHVGVVQLLISHPRIEVNILDTYGRTPLMHAARERRTEVVKVLLQFPQTRVDVADWDGMTAVDWAKFGGIEASVVEELSLRRRADSKHQSHIN